IDGHGDNVHPMGYAVALYELKCHLAVPARHKHKGGTRTKGVSHGRLHASNMKHRQSTQHHRPRRHMPPHLALHSCGHHRTVCVYATLGGTRGARTVWEHSPII